MSLKSASIILTLTLLGLAKSEPPSNSYGTPLGAPISSYGTPNYNTGNDGHQGDHGGHGDHGDQGEPKSYEFGYQVKDDYSGNNYNRKESSDGNQVRGEYRVQLPDGRTQIVTYYADWQSGFHADVRYEGEAQYPDQYNNQGGYNSGPSNQYGVPSYSSNNNYNNNQQNNGYNYNNNNNNNGYNYNQNNNGYNNQGSSATSSVSIKDYSGNTGNNNYNSAGYNYNANNINNGYDSSYSSGGFAAKRPSNEYGAP